MYYHFLARDTVATPSTYTFYSNEGWRKHPTNAYRRQRKIKQRMARKSRRGNRR